AMWRHWNRKQNERRRSSRIPRRRPQSRPTLEALEDRLAPATFIVTVTSDSGPGSLRQAILDANNTPGTDNITFSIGGGAQTISPTSSLPTITGPVSLDATTQPGFAGTPLIQLDGAGA